MSDGPWTFPTIPASDVMSSEISTLEDTAPLYIAGPSPLSSLNSLSSMSNTAPDLLDATLAPIMGDGLDATDDTVDMPAPWDMPCFVSGKCGKPATLWVPSTWFIEDVTDSPTAGPSRDRTPECTEPSARHSSPVAGPSSLKRAASDNDEAPVAKRARVTKRGPVAKRARVAAPKIQRNVVLAQGDENVQGPDVPAAAGAASTGDMLCQWGKGECSVHGTQKAVLEHIIADHLGFGPPRNGKKREGAVDCCWVDCTYKQSINYDNFARHMRNVHFGDEMATCPVCNITTRKDMLSRHLKSCEAKARKAEAKSTEKKGREA